MRTTRIVLCSFLAFGVAPGIAGCEKDAIDYYLNLALESAWSDSSTLNGLENDLESRLEDTLTEMVEEKYGWAIKEISSIEVDLGDYAPQIDITDCSATIGCGGSDYNFIDWVLHWGTGGVSNNMKVTLTLKTTALVTVTMVLDNFEVLGTGTGKVVVTSGSFSGSDYTLDYIRVKYDTSYDGGILGSGSWSSTEENGEIGSLLMNCVIYPAIRDYFGL